MTMRSHLIRSEATTPSFPLLEAGDLPGADDWSVLESLHFDAGFDSDDDRFATLSVASFDD